MDHNLIFISGYAKLPKGTIAHEIYGGLILALVVDKETGVIKKSECSLTTQVAVDFLSQIMLGKSLKDEKKIEDEINVLYHGAVKKAVISALHICAEKYAQIIHMM